MTSRIPHLALPLSCLALLVSTPAFSQRPDLSAREALGLVSTQFGPQAVQWVAEMHAEGGIPQPTDWSILAYDERAPRLLYRFWAGGGRVGDGGIDEERYPGDIPVGYFSPNQVGVDSVAAFTIAEGEARKARMAFDSCDYLLRVREYSTEPVWRLELFDVGRLLVGKVYISANSGEVFRTVWIYRDQRARPDGRPLIIDSMAPSRHPLTTGTGRSGGEYPAVAESPAQPPVPGQPGVAEAPQTYRPVSPDGRVADDSIPAPPPPAGAASPPVAEAPASPAPQQEEEMRDLHTGGSSDPSQPPVPPSSGGSSSERIPPPPIPR